MISQLSLTETMSAYQLNVAQSGDAFELLRLLPDECPPLVFFDPQYRGVLNKSAVTLPTHGEGAL
jgi:hypothetical protein